jgi:hypothetical protein
MSMKDVLTTMMGITRRDMFAAMMDMIAIIMNCQRDIALYAE